MPTNEPGGRRSRSPESPLLRPWQDLVGPAVHFVLLATFCFVVGADFVGAVLVVLAVGAVCLSVVRAVARRRAGVPPFPGGFWERQYARSQRLAEVETGIRGATLDGREPTLSTAVAPDGSIFQIRLIAPGQHLHGETMFDLDATKESMRAGDPTLRSNNRAWLVVVQRQPGPFRNVRAIASSTFDSERAAGDHVARLRRSIEAGNFAPDP